MRGLVASDMYGELIWQFVHFGRHHATASFFSSPVVKEASLLHGRPAARGKTGQCFVCAQGKGLFACHINERVSPSSGPGCRSANASQAPRSSVKLPRCAGMESSAAPARPRRQLVARVTRFSTFRAASCGMSGGSACSAARQQSAPGRSRVHDGWLLVETFLRLYSQQCDASVTLVGDQIVLSVIKS